MKAPAFQLYAQDFLVGTAMMSAEEVGGYIRLLCYQWSHGSIPDNNSVLERLAGCGGIALASIRHRFGICENGALKNEKLEKVRLEQEDYRKRQAENALKGWNKRKNNGSAMPPHSQPICQNDTLQSSPSNNTKRLASPRPAPVLPFDSEAFGAAWELFSKHRREIKKPLTPTAAEMSLKQLAAIGEQRAIRAIEHTISKGWQGLREPDQQTPAIASQSAPKAAIREPLNWRTFLNHEYPDSRFSAGQADEAHEWSDLDRSTQTWLLAEMRKKGAGA